MWGQQIYLTWQCHQSSPCSNVVVMFIIKRIFKRKRIKNSLASISKLNHRCLIKNMITMSARISRAPFFVSKPQTLWPVLKKSCLILIEGPLWCCASSHYLPCSTWSHIPIFKKLMFIALQLKIFEVSKDFPVLIT